MKTISIKSFIFGIIAIVWVFPFLFLPMLSVATEWSFPAVFPVECSGTHWQSLFSNSRGLLESVSVSLLLSLGVASLATAFGFVISKMIALHKYRGTWVLFGYFPYILSPVIYAVCLQFYFVWLGLSGSIIGILLGQFILVFPYSVLFFVDYWNERMQAYEQLVTTLGANRWDKYTKILLPMSRGMLGVCFYQCFLISWFEFGFTNFIGVGKVQTLTIKVYQFVLEANPYLAALASCLLLFPPILLLWRKKKSE